MATPLSRRPEPDDGSSWAVPTGPAAAGYLLPTTRRDIAAQAAATFGLLTGLWVAVSPLFLMLQHDGNNAAFANLIAGLVTAAVGAVALVSRRGFGALQFGSLLPR